VRRVTSTPQRSPEDIERDLAATRARFTATLDELSVRTKPEALGQDISSAASAAANDGVAKAKKWAGVGPDSDGLRPELIGALAGAGLAVVILLLRSRHHSAPVAYGILLPSDTAALEEILLRSRGPRRDDVLASLSS
jgi:hypothetical protein